MKLESGRITDWNENSGFIQDLNGKSIFFQKNDLVDKDLQLLESVTFKLSKSNIEKHVGTKVAVNIQRKGNKVNLLDYKRFVGVLKSWDGKHGFIKSTQEAKSIEFYYNKRLFLNDNFEKGNLLVFCPVTEHTYKLSGIALFAYNIVKEKDIEFLQKQFIETGNKAIEEYINTLKVDKTEKKLRLTIKSEVLFTVKNDIETRDSKVDKTEIVETFNPEDVINIVTDNYLDESAETKSAELQYIEKKEILNSDVISDQESTEELFEGIKKTVTVNSYERNPKARLLCVKHWKAICAVCNIDFEKTYGEIGKGFIHVHHLTPVSHIGENYQIDPINDLVPVCPNCHSMLHRQEPPLTILELKLKMKQLKMNEL